MNAYRDIHCLEDFGMIAGSYRVIYVDCTDTSGEPLHLSSMTEFGCKFFYYGTPELAFEIRGNASSRYPYRMEIPLDSSLTQNLGNCCLEYMPYVVMGSQVIKYGKGRIVIEGDDS